MTLRIIMSVLAAFFLLGGGGYAGYTYFSKPKPQTYVICKADVKQCKDGITVNRISPLCEFATCPEDRPEGTGGIKVLNGTPIVGAYTGTLESVRENGGDYQCTMKTDDGVTGTIYASQGELRGDFDPVVKPNIRAVSTHLILAKTATHAWTGVKNSGITFIRGGAEGDAQVKDLLPFDPTLPHAFECIVWMRDASQFVPPPDVMLKDLSPVLDVSTSTSAE
jgi:hypothetical protein